MGQGNRRDFTKDFPCPACDGHRDMPPKQGTRCWGYDTGLQTFVCKRDEYKGTLSWDTKIGGYYHKWSGCQCGNKHFRDEERGARNGHPTIKPTYYIYRDASGNPVMANVKSIPKKFRLQHPVGNDWVNCNKCNHDVLPYNLPGLLSADANEPVFITEGEKDAETLIAKGYVATTNLHGAGKFHNIKDLTPFNGKIVLPIGDHDKDGRNHDRVVASTLKGIASRVIPFGPLYAGEDNGRDITDWINEGNGVAGRLAGLLADRATQAILKVTWASDVVKEEQRWLWPGYIPADTITMLIGDAEKGKSFVSLAIASCVSNGSYWPLVGGIAPLGNVVVLSVEDTASTIRTRLELLGADLNKIAIIDKFAFDPYQKSKRLISMQAHIGEIERVVKKTNAKLLIVDHILAFTGEMKSKDYGGVVQVLAPLGDLSERLHCPVLCLHHINKDTKNTSMSHRAMVHTGMMLCRFLLTLYILTADGSKAAIQGIGP